MISDNKTTVELTHQEAAFIHDYFQQALEEENLSNFSKTIMINVIQKLSHE